MYLSAQFAITMSILILFAFLDYITLLVNYTVIKNGDSSTTLGMTSDRSERQATTIGMTSDSNRNDK